MRFKLILPLTFLALSVLLTIVGETQRLRVIKNAINPRTGRVHEVVPYYFARARYVDYLINLPAWSSVQIIPIVPLNFPLNLPTYPPILRGNYDWWYFMCVAILWAFLGWWIDDRDRSATRKASVKQRRVVGMFCLGYAAFIQYVLVDTCMFEGPPGGGCDRWFFYGGCVWTLLLVVIAGRLLFGSRNEPSRTMALPVKSQ